jgi:5-methylthioribose kinase
MLWLDESNAEAYLRDICAIGLRERVQIEVLSGGVSNQVLYVARADSQQGDFVLKQARAQLRTPQPWFSNIARIWREVEVLRVCQEALAQDMDGSGSRIATPHILFEDRTCYAFAMTAAPRQHAVWKTQLLSGEADGSIAAACGRLLATLHRSTWNSANVARRLGDRQLFDELRLDPYYRTVAGLDAEAAELMQRLIASLSDHPRSLVHADFSPKNLLVYRVGRMPLPEGEGDLGLMMVDFETGHYGDPAFDLGFFLSHLVLKAVYHAPDHERFLALTERFFESYRDGMAGIDAEEYTALVARGIQNFAGCAWARIDGKSRVEYFVDSPRREPVRELCRGLLRDPSSSWPEVLRRCDRFLATTRET